MHDCDPEQAKENIYLRSPFLEFRLPHVDSLNLAEGMESPRLLKTHLPPDFFEKPLENTQAKFVVVMRNLKDNLVSYYHFNKNNTTLGNFGGGFPEFFDLFRNKLLASGDWFDMNLQWWALRHNPKIHIVKYEDLQKDVLAEIKKIAKFLGVDPSEEQLEVVRQHVSFESMKQNPSVNRKNSHVTNFYRKGKVGSWKEECISPEYDEILDELLAKKLEGSGLHFEYE